MDSETSYLKALKTDPLLPPGLSLSLVRFNAPGKLSWGWVCGSNSDGNVATDWGSLIPVAEVLMNGLNGVGV